MRIASLLIESAVERLELNRTVTQTTGRGEGRDEGGERGYYHLRHKLYDTFLIHSLHASVSLNLRRQPAYRRHPQNRCRYWCQSRLG